MTMTSTTTTIDRIADAIRDASDDPQGWERRDLVDLAHMVTECDRYTWVSRVATVAGDFTEADRMIAAADAAMNA